MRNEAREVFDVPLLDWQQIIIATRHIAAHCLNVKTRVHSGLARTPLIYYNVL